MATTISFPSGDLKGFSSYFDNPDFLSPKIRIISLTQDVHTCCHIKLSNQFIPYGVQSIICDNCKKENNRSIDTLSILNWDPIVVNSTDNLIIPNKSNSRRIRKKNTKLIKRKELELRQLYLCDAKLATYDCDAYVNAKKKYHSELKTFKLSLGIKL